jgi:hypothetical protein
MTQALCAHMNNKKNLKTNKTQNKRLALLPELTNRVYKGLGGK